MSTVKNTAAVATSERWVCLAGEDSDASIDAFELFSARRALKLLKTNLGRERLLELLQDEIAAGTAFLRENVERSAGQVASGTTTLRAHGISAAQFTSWLSRAFGRDEVMIAGHPEHYSIHAGPGRGVNIVETLGEHVCSFFMREWDESVVPEQDTARTPSGASEGRRSHLLLDDETVVGSIANAFDEQPDGFSARLSVTLPFTCGAEVVEQHLEHFAVEFRNWILMAAAEQATPAPTPVQASRAPRTSPARATGDSRRTVSTGSSAPPGGSYGLAGRPVPRLGYGMGQVTRSAGTADGRVEAVALLRRAFDLGVRHFDTAQFYSNGLANQLLADAFSDVRDEIVIATKAGARPVPGAAPPLTAAQRPHELREAVEANLTTLGTDRLDVVNLRRMDFRPGLLADGDQVVPLEDQLAELAALRDEGKVIGIGISHITLDQFHAARSIGLACVQNIYHLLDRTFEALLDACRDHDVAWVPYFPLGGGGEYAGLPKVVDDTTVQSVAAGLGATPTQVGLAWQLTHAKNTMLIPGTASPRHLRENTAAGDLTLDAATMARLEASTESEQPPGAGS